MKERPVLAALGVAVAYALAVGALHLVPRHDTIVLPLAAAAVFALLDGATPRARTFGLHAVTQIFVVGFLAQIWTVGFEGRNAIFGGILPWSDAQDFYDDALRFVHGAPFTELAQRRPMFSATLALLLRVTGQELRAALLVFAIGCGLSAALVSAEVRERFGRRAGLFAYVLLLFCARRWTGFVQTEHVGLPLGAAAFVLLLRAEELAARDRAKARRLALAGIYALTLALMARTGAFFVLPALALWGARTLAEHGQRRRWFFAAAGAGALGALTNALVAATTGEAAAPGSDYPLIFYGLLHDTDFVFLFQVHPELAAMPVEARVPMMWTIIGREIAASPLLLVTGLLRALASFVISPHGLFGWVWSNPDDHVLENAAEVRAAMAGQGILGPLALWVRRLGGWSLANAAAMGALGAVFAVAWLSAFVRLLRDRALRVSLLGHVTIGVVLSTAFTPAWITSSVQVQTATFGFVVALPAVVWLGRREAGESSGAPWPPSPRLAAVPLAYGVALVLGVRLLHAMPAPIPPADAAPCAGEPPATAAALSPAAGEHVLRPAAGTAFEVADHRAVRLRTKSEDDLRASLGFLGRHSPELAASLAPWVRPGTVFVAAFDACDRHTKILVDDGRRVDPRDATFKAYDVVPLATPRVLRVRGP